MAKQLPSLIAADMRRIKDEQQAKAIYGQYLSILGAIDAKLAPMFVAQCETELSSIESGSGNLATAIRNYKLATADMLLWRKRTAESAASSMKATGDCTELAKTIQTKSFHPNLTVGLDKVAAVINPESLGQITYANNLHSINANASYGSYSDRTWATVIGSVDLSAELTALKNDLFVTDQSPPMSPAAARSIVSCQNNHFAAVGGRVSGVQVESFESRFAKLPASMNSFVSMDQVPHSGPIFGQTILRFNLKPIWVQHEHFYKRVQ